MVKNHSKGLIIYKQGNNIIEKWLFSSKTWLCNIFHQLKLLLHHYSSNMAKSSFEMDCTSMLLSFSCHFQVIVSICLETAKIFTFDQVVTPLPCWRHFENGVLPQMPPKALWNLLFVSPFLLRVENSLLTFPVLRVSVASSRVFKDNNFSGIEQKDLCSEMHHRTKEGSAWH